MATPLSTKVDSSVPADRDRVVRTLDEFPELQKALRTGDVPMGRTLCAKLFNVEACPGAPLAMRAKAC